MQTASTFPQRLDARVAEALDMRLVDRVSTGKSTGFARALAFALVTPVHLVSLALAVGGTVLLVRGDGWWQWLMAAVILGVAWLTRPHILFAADPDSVLVDPERAPGITTLVAQVAQLLGTRPPTEIRIDSEFNAYVAPRGLRGRQLVLGAPLWVALGPQERVALLGHEIGHLAHGDLMSSRYVASARQTLLRWVDLLDPDGTEVFENDTPVLVRALMAPPRWAVLGYLRLLGSVNSTASRRQELYADLAAAMAAGTTAAIADHEISLLAEGIDVIANRAAVDSTRPHLGDAIIARVAAYDASQRAAARRAAADDRRSVDNSHPPTVDRLRLVESVDPFTASIVLEAAQSRRIDRELAPALDRAFKRLGDSYRHVQ
ncbi:MULTISPECIES: M48 family metallopeptidase [unclassified Nocardioides]|uniref:M48 family metallopeptidase n=1 Tax=unclassified Nocardioides TaxID=2615069 RepID=UPI00138F8BA0|nr:MULTISPECIES: M48 family metallopeptidase [unclassified Nocardioides]